MGAELTQAELYQMTNPPEKAREFIIEMVEESLAGLNIPEIHLPLTAEEKIEAAGLISMLIGCADKVFSKGLLTLMYHVDESYNGTAVYRILELVEDGSDFNELIATVENEFLTDKIQILAIYGGLMIACGYQGFVLEMFLTNLIKPT